MAKESNEESDSKAGNFLKRNSGNIISSVLASLLTMVIGLVITNFAILPVHIDYVRGDISRLDDNDTALNQRLDGFASRLDGMSERVDLVYNQFLLTSRLIPTADFSYNISGTYNRRGYPGDAHAVKLSSDCIVAYGVETGAAYTVEDVADQSVLLPYTSGNQEVYFYGQFNENGCWDGNCILNTYENNKLVLITDAVYDDGNLISSKQIFYYNLRSGQEVWAYSDYVRKEGYGSGDTWLYIKESDCTKSFSIDNVSTDDILSADKFKEMFCHRFTAFYSGNTSDGFFNDETGDAYMVYFFEDGTVRLLYSGNFKDGTFNDNTGKAWYIVKDVDTAYMYAKGPFKNGEIDVSKSTEKGYPPLSLEQIQGYMAQREFDFPFKLKWAGLGQTET